MYADTGTEAPTANPFLILYDYDGNGNMIYQGWAKAGSMTGQPVWAIKRFQYGNPNSAIAGKCLRQDWANGTSSQINVWDNRATLKYA